MFAPKAWTALAVIVGTVALANTVAVLGSAIVSLLAAGLLIGASSAALWLACKAIAGGLADLIAPERGERG